MTMMLDSNLMVSAGKDDVGDDVGDRSESRMRAVSTWYKVGRFDVSMLVVNIRKPINSLLIPHRCCPM